SAGHRLTSSRRVRRLRTTLVVVEIALAGVLCAGSIQLWRHYRALAAADHGFTTDGVLTFRVAIPVPTQPEPGAIGLRIDALRQALIGIDGVRHVGATTNLPWSGYDENADLRVVGRGMRDEASTSVRYQAATDGYFEAMGMRVLGGRTFDATLDTRERPLVLVINDAAARQAFPAGDAVGARVRAFGEEREVIGVVRGVGDFPTSTGVEPAMWFPLAQVEFVDLFFTLRVDGPVPTSRLDAVRTALARVDPFLPISDVQTMAARGDAALAEQRLALRLFQAFAGLSLVLAASGLYGLLAYVVHQRRKEMGIRAAVGATRADLARLVLRDSLTMAVVGALACAAILPTASAAWMTWTSGLGALDGWTWAGTPTVLLAIALGASIGPARLAARQVDGAALKED
ncbi:MAG TPA: FtsX-like permease family protein, partial [Luteitalea sp.]|nr:FtsX-like permease family protein [Luteitalea sp.]